MADGDAFSVSFTPHEQTLGLHGAATIHTAGRLGAALRELPRGADIDVDLSGLAKIDTAGAYLLVATEAQFSSEGKALKLIGANRAMQDLLARVRQSQNQPVDNFIHKLTTSDRLENLGRSVASGGTALSEWFGVFGLFLTRLGRALLHPREFRLTSLVHHIQEVGLKAVPIVVLMAFLIGVVLAFQGSAQLRQFGAEVFVVDLIAISILRELGILLTAIIVAGRTASAFTAAIGSMKMREELDAMRTLAIDPGQALIVPRILALLISLPILGLLADISGLIGGALMAWAELGISPGMFQTRLLEGTDSRHIWVGLVKAPVFAMIIGVIGCWAGLKVERDAESLGRMTSSAVVAAIFAVIVADAVFSIFFAQLGI